jgi:hypothetical protein
MMDMIDVRPLAVGWLVEGGSFDNGLTFRSGAAAERAARRLAEQYARAGRATAVRIFLRDGSLAGRFLYPQSAAPLAIAS